MGLMGKWYEEMQKNRPTVPAHATTGQPIMNALTPTVGVPSACMTTSAARQQLSAQELVTAQQALAGAYNSVNVTITNQMTQQQLAGCFILQDPQMIETQRLMEQQYRLMANPAIILPRDCVAALTPSPAELRQEACDRMGEARCSTACYTAARHVEKVPKKVKGWRNAKDLNRPATMPFWMVPVPGAPAMMQSVVATIPDLPARGRGKLEHDNPHLRPRWR